MSSSEEYLDSLLKAIMEGNTNGGSSPSMVQEVTEEDVRHETSAPGEPDMTVNMDDIEAAFASMGADTAEEDTQEVVPADEELLSDEQAPDAGMLFGELSVDDGMLPDELALNETILSDGHMLNEETITDEAALTDGLTLDDGMLTDELTLDDSLSSNELSMGDEVLPDELILDDGMLTDELALDDSILSGELALDDEVIPDDFAFIENENDGFEREEYTEESVSTDDLSFDELGLADLGLEDLGLMEEAEAGDNFALEDETEAGGDFTLEDGVDVGGDFVLENEAEGDDGFVTEDTGDDDADLSAFLASMGGDDDLSEISDLLEKSDQGVVVDDDIMAMLGSVSGGDEGDDSFDFFSIEGNPEDIREITPEELAERGDRKSKRQRKKEEKERKKRDKQAKKAKNKNASQDVSAGEESVDDLNSLLGDMDEAGDKPKKKGAFSRFVDFLLEEDEEEDGGSGGYSGDNGAVLGNLSEENKELLAELNAEDQKNAKKKDKKEKKAKKDKKGKTGAKDGNGKEKAESKPKKPKKEKVKKEKKKKEKKVEEPQVPEKKLSKKKVISVFIFCATIAACIVVVTILLPEQLEKQEARVAFDQSQYTQVYELLYGKELSEDDEVLLHKSSTILKLQRKLDSYENYERMDMPLEALNALLEGVSRYQNLKDDAELYNVSSEVADIYEQILDLLIYNYGLSETDALDIIASGDDITYSQRIQAVISGESFGVDESALPEEKQDVLPEEEEIIDRLEGTETE